MLNEQISRFLNDLTKQTNAGKVRWESMRQFVPSDIGFPDILNKMYNLFQNEFRHVILTNSFYARHKKGIVVLIQMDNESGKDGSHSNSFAIMMQINTTSPVFASEDNYFQNDAYILYNAIIRHINKDLSLPDALYDFMSFND